MSSGPRQERFAPKLHIRSKVNFRMSKRTRLERCRSKHPSECTHNQHSDRIVDSKKLTSCRPVAAAFSAASSDDFRVYIWHNGLLTCHQRAFEAPGPFSLPGFKPKKSGPDQRVPVIRRAISDRLRYRLPWNSKPVSVIETVTR